MSVLDDFLQGYQSDATQPDGTIPAPPQAPGPLAPPAAAANPSILDILRATGGPGSTPLPAAPQGDLSGIPALALMRFAAQVTAPKAYGQSNLNAITGAASGALEYADSLKRATNEQAMQQELNRRRMAAADAQLQSERLGQVATAQGIQQKEARAPLELENLKNSIAKAKTDQELAALNVRLGKIKEKYADAVTQAELAEKNAKTDEQRAQASMERAHAEFFRKQIDEYSTMLDAKRRESRAPKMQPGGVPGDRQMYEKDGQFYYAPMPAADAKAAADREADALVAIGALEKGQRDIKRNQLAAEYIRGNQPATGAAPSAPSAPAPMAGASSGGPAAVSINPQVVPQDRATYTEAMKASQQSPRQIIQLHLPNSKLTTYLVGGKEVSKAEVDRMLGKSAVSSGAGGYVRPGTTIQVGNAALPGPRVSGPQKSTYSMGTEE